MTEFTYPPELLPPPDEGDEVDVFVCNNHRGTGPCPHCQAIFTTNHGSRTRGINFNRRDGMSEWQPIETAPKDGTEFIAWGIIHGGSEAEDEVTWTGCRWIRHGGWTATKPTGRYSIGFTPTHWMPLPAKHAIRYRAMLQTALKEPRP